MYFISKIKLKMAINMLMKINSNILFIQKHQNNLFLFFLNYLFILLFLIIFLKNLKFEFFILQYFKLYNFRIF